MIEWILTKDFKAYIPKKKSQKNNYSSEGRKLKFCNGCKKVWEVGITGTILRYGHMPSYGLIRKNCSKCH